MASSTMASTILINAVRERRALWDPTDPQHNDRHVINFLWDEVAEIIGGSREVAKTKWRSLRDYYRHEQRRAMAMQPGTYKSSWNHYDRMHFLRDTTQRNRAFPYHHQDGMLDDGVSFNHLDQLPVEAVVKVEYDDEDGISSSENHVMRIEDTVSLAGSQQSDKRVVPQFDLTDGDRDVECSYPYRSSTPLSVASQNSHKALESCKKRPSSDSDKQDLDRRKVLSLERLVVDNDCDDLHFFKSLIPDVKDLPRSRKASLRLKIQQLICKEVYGENTETEEMSETVETTQERVKSPSNQSST